METLGSAVRVRFCVKNEELRECLLKEKFCHLLKTVRHTLFRETITMGFCRRGQRLGSNMNTTRKSKNL